MADIFISYKREDRARIAPLARALEARGYTVWWDLELVAGQKWGKKIKAELDAAKCVIVAWTRASVAEDQTYASEWVENEADSAHRRGVLVPVLLDEGRIAWTHQRVQFAALTGWSGDPDHPGVADLMKGVSQHAGVRATPEAVELTAWTQAERTETAEAFQGFLTAFPRSRFAEIARGRAAELEEAAAWSALGSAPTIAALAGFLRRYPAGRFADDAEVKIKALELASAGHSSVEPQSAGNDHSGAEPNRRVLLLGGVVGASALVGGAYTLWRARDEAAQRVRLAIFVKEWPLPIPVGEEPLPTGLLEASLAARLSETKRFEVVDNSRFRNALAQMSRHYGDGALTEVGRSLGADYVVTIEEHISSSGPMAAPSDIPTEEIFAFRLLRVTDRQITMTGFARATRTALRQPTSIDDKRRQARQFYQAIAAQVVDRIMNEIP
jgi:hypothetical protein